MMQMQIAPETRGLVRLPGFGENCPDFLVEAATPSEFCSPDFSVSQGIHRELAAEFLSLNYWSQTYE